MEINVYTLINAAVYLLLYVSTVVFIVGVWYQISDIVKSPNPLVIPQTPQSDALCGVIRGMAGDLFVFKSLSKGNFYLWMAGLTFHITFAVLMGFHLFGLVTYLASENIHISSEIMETLSIIASLIGVLFITSLIALMIIRSNDEKSSYYSGFFDYFVVMLIFMIGVTGVFMKISAFSPNLPAVKNFMINVFSIHPKAVPLNPFFIAHISLVSIMLMVFPFTKLIHAVGFFFSPTKNMPNNPRTVRHINVWD